MNKLAEGKDLGDPETHSLEGCCSIQLSYGTILYLGLQS